MIADRIVALPLTAESLQLAVSPPLLHRAAMRFLPDLKGMSSAIRADTGTLLRLDLPSDPLGVPGQISLRLRGPAIPIDLTPTPTLSLTDGSQIVLRLAAELRRTDQSQRTQRPVPDDVFEQWATRLLTDVGLAPENLRFSRAKIFGARPQPTTEANPVRFVIRDVSATVAVSDNGRAQDAYARGVGRGRAYGLGMIVVTANPIN